jgi:organic hydroperoxide reductase OsmC/OhrA
MIKYPIEFHSEVRAQSGVSTTWNSAASGYKTTCAIPPEFMGPGGGLSPEDLYNHALANCFVATFKVYAANSKLAFEGIEVSSRLVVDVDETKKPIMKEFFLNAKIKAAANPAKAKLLAEKASQFGFILNSVKTKCNFEFEIT